MLGHRDGDSPGQPQVYSCLKSLDSLICWDMPLRTRQGGAVGLGSSRVELGLRVVFAPFGVLGFS